MSRPALGIFALLLLPAGCGRPPRRCPGETGYLSDRAREVHSELSGAVDVPADLAPVAGSGWTESPPLLPWLLADLARVDADRGAAWSVLGPDARTAWRLDAVTPARRGWSRVEYTARVWRLVRDDEVPADVLAELAEDPVVLQASPLQSGARPDYGALAADGVLRIGALFAQIDTEEERPDDPGHTSRDVLVRHLQEAGLAGTSRDGVWTLAGTSGGLEVVVEAHGPDTLRLEADPEDVAARIAAVAGRNEVLYVNAHAGWEPLEVLADPATYAPGGYRVVALDVCWAYLDLARPVLQAQARAAPGVAVHLVTAAGRVVTGSVGSFLGLLDGLAVGTIGQAAAPPGWLDLVAEMNRRALERASARRDRVAPRLRAPEVYGVSGLRE